MWWKSDGPLRAPVARPRSRMPPTTPPGPPGPPRRREALEDLGGGGAGGTTPRTDAPKPPDAARIKRLLRDIQERKAQIARTIADAQKQSANWDKERAKAESLSNESMAKKAERNADLERARMHTALAEMAELQTEEKSLEHAAQVAATAPRVEPVAADARAGNWRQGGGTSVDSSSKSRPSVAEELDRMRRQAEGAGPSSKSSSKATRPASSAKSRPAKGSAVDDELAALKRKMAQKRRG